MDWGRVNFLKNIKWGNKTIEDIKVQTNTKLIKSMSRRQTRRHGRRRVLSRRGLWALTLLLMALVFGGLLARQKLPYYIYPVDYFEIISAEAESVGLDPYLISAVIKAESNFREDALSSAGAVGLMQLMPSTAEWLAAKGGCEFELERLCEPEYNIRLGCQYLRFLLDYWQWDVCKALASYNAGQTNVARWLNEGIWDGTGENLADIPFNETQKYVDKVLRIYQEYQELY